MSAADRAASLALVVDDELTNRLLLKAILGKSGFDVVEAENGEVAVERFNELKPDIIFMDAMMPVMDGYEAASLIKAAAGDDFIPIIFLTALTDKESLARCIDVGGDDFLTKPISATLLKAKVRALERIRDLQRELRSLYDQMRHDEEIAETVFEQIVHAHSDTVSGPRYRVFPAGLFSGDMYLAECSPNGDMNILLADVTGHGLAAALAAMPAADAFRELTRKGFGPEQIVSQINDKLYHSLPRGMFMALQFISINSDHGRVAVSNCGMPDALVVDGATRQIKQRIKSTALPLGISAEIDLLSAIQYVPVGRGDYVLLASDGVVEAQNGAGDYYGESRYEAAVAASVGQAGIIDSVVADLRAFCGSTRQADDISVVEIPFNDELLGTSSASVDISYEQIASRHQAAEVNAEDVFEVAMQFQGAMLAKADPVPMLLGQINELMDLKEHKNVLFTILSELFNNALDHGVLGLDSSLKQGAEGFAQYYTLRENKLQALSQGRIDVKLNVVRGENGGRILMRLEDSGPGFDHHADSVPMGEGELLSRRGVPLVRELCDFVTYLGRGNIVEAVYSWCEGETGSGE